MADLQKPPTSFNDISGWFWWLDRMMFSAILESQADSAPGVLVELGAYQGKSAVIIGDHLREDERFVVVDLFGDDDLLDAANRNENSISYSTLTRRQFERNYLALHDELPEVVQGPSSEVLEHVAPGSARFVHVDASHQYEHVRADALAAATMLRPGGVVVFDDYRAGHTPGVAAAVWEAVVTGGLIPVALTPRKFYGVFSDPDPVAEAIRALVDSDRRLRRASGGVICGHRLMRVDNLRLFREPTTRPAELRLSRRIGAGSGLVSNPGAGLTTKADRPLPDSALSRPRRFVRRVARDWMPSTVTRWVVSRRRA